MEGVREKKREKGLGKSDWQRGWCVRERGGEFLARIEHSEYGTKGLPRLRREFRVVNEGLTEEVPTLEKLGRGERKVRQLRERVVSGKEAHQEKSAISHIEGCVG